MKLDPLHELILDFIEKTNKPIFMTGKAGTGKTTFLRYIRSQTKKNLAIVAPTAVAAINAGGVTIHSFFQVPFGPVIPLASETSFSEFSGKSFGTEKAKLIKCLDLLIIDEISMVRADTIDYIDRVLQFLKGSNRPFGGIQLLMIGDLYQLPPVFQQDWHLLGKFYKGPYFFDSLIFNKFPIVSFELEKVYRQSDPKFIKILNNIRNGSIDETLLKSLNQQVYVDSEDKDLAQHVTLTTHNPLVKKINEERLEKLGGVAFRFKAKISGEFPKEGYPTDEELVLKKDAMVMFIKNDSSGKKQFYNGRTARVEEISQDRIKLIFLDDGSDFEAVQEVWENTKYSLSESEQKVSQTSAGSFIQFPLKLAWAITIHKSQGLTFNEAVIDVSAAFAHGQTYVALSRCRNLEGLVLKEKVEAKNIITDPSVAAFMKKAQIRLPKLEDLNSFIQTEERELVVDTFSFESLKAGWEHFKIIIAALLPAQNAIEDQVVGIQNILENKINKIGQKFITKELKGSSLSPNGVELLRNRLAKAGEYFSKQLTELNLLILALHQHLKGAPFHSDYFPTLNLILEQIEVKIQLFKHLSEDKDIAQINKVTKLVVDKYKPTDGWIEKQNNDLKIENPLLYHELLNWRKQTAEIKKTLSYHIISDQALADISTKLPKTLSQLSKIKNIGEGKASQYGDQIIKLIRQYLGESELLF